MDKDRFAALIQLAEFARQVRNDRRKTEWQLSFALWAMLAAAEVALKGLSLCNLTVVGAAIVVMHGWWVGWNFLRADKDASDMYNLLFQAEHELSIEQIHFESRKKRHPLTFFKHPPALLQWLTTVALVIGAIVVIRGRP